jgi:hypothetical protein
MGSPPDRTPQVSHLNCLIGKRCNGSPPIRRSAPPGAQVEHDTPAVHPRSEPALVCHPPEPQEGRLRSSASSGAPRRRAAPHRRPSQQALVLLPMPGPFANHRRRSAAARPGLETSGRPVRPPRVVQRTMPWLVLAAAAAQALRTQSRALPCLRRHRQRSSSATAASPNEMTSKAIARLPSPDGLWGRRQNSCIDTQACGTAQRIPRASRAARCSSVSRCGARRRSVIQRPRRRQGLLKSAYW